MNKSILQSAIPLIYEKNLPYFIVIIGLISLLAAIFLFPSPQEFPMDDAYIHFVYAQNLASYGELMFNEPGETGVAITSLTWVLLLAGASWLGIPMELAAKFLGVSSLALFGCLLFMISRYHLPRTPALLLTLLVSGSGHFLWFALSGMETILFILFGLLSLVLYRQRHWVALGGALGLMILTRPDGLALAGAIGIYEILKNWKRPKELLSTLLPTALTCLVVCSPWFIYLFARTGHLLPTSALGKQMSSKMGIEIIISRNPNLAFLTHLSPVIYTITWIVYLLEFVLGGMVFPGPGLAIGSIIGNSHYTISFLGMAAWGAVILPLVLSFGKHVSEFLRSRSFQESNFSITIIIAIWVILHNAAYALFLPIPGTASRYGALNHLALWSILVGGFVSLRLKTALRIAIGIGLFSIGVTNTLYWNSVYDANIEHMSNVRIAASEYISDSIPITMPIAAFDVGVLRYRTGRPITDLGGLIDPELGHTYAADRSIDRYLYDRQTKYVVLPGRAGSSEEGWFDFAKEMGLTQSQRFRLNLVKVFEIPFDRWLLGYMPTNNYQATVTIYELIPSSSPIK